MAEQQQQIPPKPSEFASNTFIFGSEIDVSSYILPEDPQTKKRVALPRITVHTIGYTGSGKSSFVTSLHDYARVKYSPIVASGNNTVTTRNNFCETPFINIIDSPGIEASNQTAVEPFIEERANAVIFSKIPHVFQSNIKEPVQQPQQQPIENNNQFIKAEPHITIIVINPIEESYENKTRKLCELAAALAHHRNDYRVMFVLTHKNTNHIGNKRDKIKELIEKHYNEKAIICEIENKMNYTSKQSIEEDIENILRKVKIVANSNFKCFYPLKSQGAVPPVSKYVAHKPVIVAPPKKPRGLSEEETNAVIGLSVLATIGAGIIWWMKNKK